MGYFTGWPCLILKCSEDNFASVANITFPDFDLDAGVAASDLGGGFEVIDFTATKIWPQASLIGARSQVYTMKNKAQSQPQLPHDQ